MRPMSQRVLADEEETSFDASTLAPQLVSLGVAVGLLIPTGDSTYEVNGAWFTDPLGNSGEALKRNGAEIAQLLIQILGELAGNALGIPTEDLGALGTWLPIPNPSTGEASSLYLVTLGAADGVTQIFGLGILYRWKISLAAAEDLVGPSALEVRVWGLIPVLTLGPAGLELVIGGEEYPMTAGLEVAGADGEPLLDMNGLSFNGLRLSAGLHFSGGAGVEISIVVTELRIPMDETPRDRSLADLVNLSGTEILSTVSALFLGALSQIMAGSERSRYVLPLLGLSPLVPGTETRLPLLSWDKFLALATTEGADLAQPFIDWFNLLLLDTELLAAWLQTVGGVISGSAGAITGDGSRANPYAMVILEIVNFGALSLTLATEVPEDGSRHFYPGLAYRSQPFLFGDPAAAGLALAASLELAEFILSPGKAQVSFDLRFQAGMELSGPNAEQPLYSGTGVGGDYVLGSITAGMRLESQGDAPTVTPWFLLENVVTPAGSYASLDLTDPGDLVQEALESLYLAADAALAELFGTEGSLAFGKDLAVLLGVTSPTLTSGSWPESLAPPFSASQLASSFQNPTTALANYYARLLDPTSLVEGKGAFSYILEVLGGLLLAAGAPALTVSGAGTAADPWRVALTAADFPADLIAYVTEVAEDATQQRLLVGLALAPSIETNGLEIDLEIRLLAFSLTLAKDGSALTAAQIFPGLSLLLELPQGLTTTAVAGASLHLDSAHLFFEWSPYSSWSWSMFAEAPALILDGTSMPVGENLDYSDKSGLTSLVTESASSFAPLLTALLGVVLYRTGSPAGLALNGILGLLPDLGPYMPEGLDWPAGMPTLSPANFDDPLGDLEALIQAFLAEPERANGVLTLLAWSMGNGAVPSLAGSGVYEDPYLVALPLPAEPQLTIWSDGSGSFLGFGLAHLSTTALPNGFAAAVSLRLDMAEVALTAAETPARATLPGVILRCKLTGFSAVFGVEVQDLTVGFAIGLTPELSFEPLVEIGYGGEDYTLAEILAGETARIEIFNGVLYELLAELDEAIGADEVYREVVSVLKAMGLVQGGAASISEAGAAASALIFGINPGGWSGLISDPLVYAETAVLEALADPAIQTELVNLICRMTGVTLPTMPKALLETLHALGFVLDATRGYLVDPAAVAAFFHAPAEDLAERFAALMENPILLAELLAQTTSNFGVYEVGSYRFEIRDGKFLILELPEANAYDFGGLVELSGYVQLNLPQDRLEGFLRFRQPTGNFSLLAATSYALGMEAPEVKVSLVWGNGTQPEPAPVQLWPFSSELFTEEISFTAPAYALDTFVSGLMNEALLNPYPLAQVAFSAFGLAHEEEGLWYCDSFLGLFQNPLLWLLNDAVLGADGQLNIERIATWLAALPAVEASNGMGVRAIADGAQLYGLPYGLELDLTADRLGGLFLLKPRLAEPLSLLEGTAELTGLSFSLSLGRQFQPGLIGSIELKGEVGGASELLAAAGYDGTFALVAGFADGMRLQIVPFPGWQTLLTEVGLAFAQTIMDELLPQVLDELETAEGLLGQFITQLRATAEVLQTGELIDAVLAAQPDRAAIQGAALDWLKGRLSEENAAATMRSILKLLGGFFSGLKAEGSLLLYRPAYNLPVTIQLGTQTLDEVYQLGIWAKLELPDETLVRVTIEPTGVGMPVATIPNGPPLFHFGLEIRVPIEGDIGPALLFQFDSARESFVLWLNPLAGDETASTLARELLPEFFGGAADPSEAVLAWLLEVAVNVVPRYLSVVALNTSGMRSWLDAPIFSNGLGPTPGAVLSASQLLVLVDGIYRLNSFQNLAELTTSRWLAEFLGTLLAEEIQVLEIGESGGVWVGPRSAELPAFGLRALIPDIGIPGFPNILFQFGDPDIAWIEASGGDAALLKPGFAIYLPITEVNGIPTPDFSRLELDLVNIGLDFLGRNQRPLVNLSRFSIEAIKPRGMVTMAFGQSEFVQQSGGKVLVEGIGVSLAPNNAVSGGKSNPVAQNLLNSGAPSSGVAPSNPPANPGFSLATSYAGTLRFAFLGADGQPAERIWIPVQRAFGPLQCNQIGMGWTGAPDYLIELLFDGSVSLAGLYLGLQELAVGIPATDPTNYSDYELDLSGLSLRFDGGGVSLSGGFLKTEDPLSYTGEVLAKLSQFTILGLGSYALMAYDPSDPSKTAPSFFAFVNLIAPLGPHPAFFIEGIAGGFGYNRDLRIPEPGTINAFPLVQGAIDTAVFGGAGTPPASALELLVEGKWIEPKIGQYWLAAGLKVSNFKLLNTFALMMVKFGDEFSIEIVGVTSASMPPQMPPSSAFAYVELGLVLAYRPKDGVASARAQLTPNSFLLAKNCRLTGGFAAELWFDGEHSGQFVVTLGGYHPAFVPPDYYPSVPRLGFNWPIAEGEVEIGVTGGAYFALTPSSIMAGFFLKLLFHSGPLRAWFSAGADFLIAWQPFHFTAVVSISVGVSFKTKILGVSLTLTVSLGAGLELWGPPTGGKVYVDWYIISFTIPIGTKLNEGSYATLSWSEFEAAFLPQPLTLTPASTGTGEEEAEVEIQEVVKLQVISGLLEDALELGWVVQPAALTLAIRSAIPPTLVSVTGSEASFSGPAIGVQPMRVGAVTTPLRVTLSAYDELSETYVPVDLPLSSFLLTCKRGGSPDALWSQALFNPFGAASAAMVADAIYELNLSLGADEVENGVGPIDLLGAFEHDLAPELALPFDGSRGYEAAATMEQVDPLAVLEATLMAPEVAQVREEVLAALRDEGIEAPLTVNLSVTATFAENLFQAPPTLSHLGQNLAQSPASGAETFVLAPLRASRRERESAASVSRFALRAARVRSLHPAPLVPALVLSSGKGAGVCGAAPCRHPTRTSWIAEGTPGMRRFLRESSAGERRRLQLGEGALLILDCDAGQRLGHCGGPGLRLLCLDRFERLLAVQDFEAGTLELPVGTARLVLQAMGANASWRGWRRDTALTRVVFSSFVGDGFLLQPQNAPMPSKSRVGAIAALGEFDTGALLEANLVLEGGALREGWLETVFHCSGGTASSVIALALADGDSGGCSPARIRLARTDAPGAPSYGEAATPFASRRGEGFGLFFYEAPPGDGEHLAVLVSSQNLRRRLLALLAHELEPCATAGKEALGESLYAAWSDGAIQTWAAPLERAAETTLLDLF